MNKFENIRVMLREAQKEINELENIAINFSAEIEKQNARIIKATDYMRKNNTDYKVVQEVNRILRVEQWGYY